MRKILAGIGLTAGLMMAGTANAADLYIANFDNDGLHGVDVGSVTVNGSVRSAWTVVVYAKNSLIAERPHAYVVSKEDFDCKQRRNRTSYMIAYDMAGEVVMQGEASNRWTPVPPDTRVEAVWEAVCEPENLDPKYRETMTFLDIATKYRGWLAKGGFRP